MPKNSKLVLPVAAALMIAAGCRSDSADPTEGAGSRLGPVDRAERAPSQAGPSGELDGRWELGLAFGDIALGPEASDLLAAPVRSSMPFSVGEKLTYEVRFGPIAVGTATMHVVGMERVRDVMTYRTRFEVRGGNRLYRVEDRYESWFDTRTLSSLRYSQDINEGSYKRQRTFEIFPERRVFLESGNPEEQPSVAQPLDEGSFLYFMRTIPLEVGRTYDFHRYFRPDRNPVSVQVLRRERVRVPAGTFDAIVVRPIIRTRGIFSEGGRAEVWFADDSTRRVLQIRSRLSFGSLNLHLRSVEE
jgi:hypothetical protein